MEAYQQDLQKEVNGAHVPEAHAQITGLERAAAWKTAQATNAQVPKARLKPGQSLLGADWPGGFWVDGRFRSIGADWINAGAMRD